MCLPIALGFTFHCWAVYSRDCRIFPGEKTPVNQRGHRTYSWPFPRWGDPLCWCSLRSSCRFASAVQKELLRQKTLFKYIFTTLKLSLYVTAHIKRMCADQHPLHVVLLFLPGLNGWVALVHR